MFAVCCWCQVLPVLLASLILSPLLILGFSMSYSPFSCNSLILSWGPVRVVVCLGEGTFLNVPIESVSLGLCL